MVLRKRGKAILAILLVFAAYGAGVIIEHFEGETFTEEIITSDEAVVTYTKASNHMIDGKLNINAATAEELAELHGIGEKLAERIIKYREENGAFSQTEGIMLVQGIGESAYSNIQDKIIAE